MTRICEKFKKKNLPYFPTLGGEGGSPTKLENSKIFFEPILGSPLKDS